MWQLRVTANLNMLIDEDRVAIGVDDRIDDGRRGFPVWVVCSWHNYRTWINNPPHPVDHGLGPSARAFPKLGSILGRIQAPAERGL